MEIFTIEIFLDICKPKICKENIECQDHLKITT